MDLFCGTEQIMWAKTPESFIEMMTDDLINEKYIKGEQRIVTETNREKLPNFYESLKKPGYMELRPFYQRRRRWDEERQSKLIESFIMNVPVPPVFIYEKSYNRYEVMDGQQRITAIKNFYDNNLTLCGLEQWPELNDRTYLTLPTKIKAGIDRRSISSIVLLKESTLDEEDAIRLRQIVFERLNTGGIQLERQEIRNALCMGKLNDLLLELSKNNIFRQSWNLPNFSNEELSREDLPIHEINFFKKMEDLELILRFFALRNVKYYKKGMQYFLDDYMIKAEKFNEDDICFLKNIFETTINMAFEIYGNLLFKPYDVKKQLWENKSKKAFYDCVMIGLSRYIKYMPAIIHRKGQIIEQTIELFCNNPDGTFTGRGNTKNDIQTRIDLYAGMIAKSIAR
jgi:hypothetical protein